MTVELTKEQEAQIYCVKHGHAKFVWTFFGYVHCGRCSTQIGDTLAGIFSGDGYYLIGHKCKECTKAYTTLSFTDREIVRRLEATKDHNYDYEVILKGLGFN